MNRKDDRLYADFRRQVYRRKMPTSHEARCNNNTSMCSTYPPQGMTHSQRVTNPATTKYRMSPCIHERCDPPKAVNSYGLNGWD
ncbi:hypothetical protein TNCV_1744581 [Trichonephila clavipes]|nr:hypothetical protein TNCV_1744581 [Trichonephila clavipes]